ncbi:sensory box sigma-54 dependent transcriptional regulator [Clostridium botulinum A1 str. CFSAN002368]|nr:helix-turn-helix domain-containing protein [Clostridium botulinum]EPS52782.1 sensory box sigma-54 dependent transcriptional regulator [Clostridium botulinum A1 str. CFSAN002368]
MEIAKGNKKKAAEILNIKRSTLYYKLNQYDLI